MKKGLLTSLGCFLFVFSFSQNNAPVAVNDSIEVMSQVPITIDVLANDYDPDGDGISIKLWNSPYHGVADTVDGKFRYKSENFTGIDQFRYKIQDDRTPPKTSEFAYVQISLVQNPDVPVANTDTFELLELVPVELDILGNDTDPNNFELGIYEVGSETHCVVTVNDDSLSVTVIPKYTSYMEADFSYTARERNTAESYVSNPADVYIKILPNPDIPVAEPDTAFATGGIPVIIPVMANDYDPQGDDIEINDFWQPNHGNVYQTGDSLVYTSQISFKGLDTYWYNIREVNDTNIYSHSAQVYVEVSKNPDCPVGVPDHAAGMAFTPITIDVLANDYDPNGAPLEIWDIESTGTTSISGNKIIYTSDPIITARDSLFYRVRQKYDNDYYSEWTPVYIDLSVNPDLPVAVEDHVTARSFFPIVISPLDNDIRNTADSLRILGIKPTLKGHIISHSDSLIIYQALTNVADVDSIEYIMGDRHNEDLRAKGKIYIHITDHHYYDSLVINNINAGINADGMLFANVGQLPGEGLYGDFHPHFKYPAGDETSTIFNSLIWIGGISNQDSSLHFAGERYRQAGADFQPGPVADLYDSAYSIRFWKLWKLNKTQIDYHRNSWWKEDYQPVNDIASWPGNGDVLSGQAAQLAPYFDYNNDGIYNPLDGDCPLIRGDETVFFMMNDDKIHTESRGGKLRIEIHGMVYGYDEPADSALDNTVFVHYDLINRSDETYHETYAGIFTDFDIGYPWDDYIGSEVTRASYYAYNGKDFDYDITSFDNPNPGYGDFPPAQSITMLAGPFMDADGTDNPSGGCDYSVNGLNFGNGVADDERLGLTGFMYPSYYNADPAIAPDFYNLLKSVFHDNSHLQFGGNGHFSTAAGPDCRFIFPGDSDPGNWGTYCVPPNPPYNQEGFYWTDSSENMPGDRRGTGAMGPFTFAPGQVQEIELAYCAANGWNGAVSSVVQLMKNIDSLRSRVNNGEIIIPNSSLGVKEKKVPTALLKVYPNPASTYIAIQLRGIIPSGSEYFIYNVLGEIAVSGRIASNQQLMVNVSGLKPGFYILKVRLTEGQLTGKFIKR